MSNGNILLPQRLHLRFDVRPGKSREWVLCQCVTLAVVLTLTLATFEERGPVTIDRELHALLLKLAHVVAQKVTTRLLLVFLLFQQPTRHESLAGRGIAPGRSRFQHFVTPPVVKKNALEEPGSLRDATFTLQQRILTESNHG